MKIVSSEMKNVLPKAHLKILNAATDLSNQMDTDLYLVGGCVRAVSYTHLTLPTNREV